MSKFAPILPKGPKVLGKPRMPAAPAVPKGPALPKTPTMPMMKKGGKVNSKRGK